MELEETSQMTKAHVDWETNLFPLKFELHNSIQTKQTLRGFTKNGGNGNTPERGTSLMMMMMTTTIMMIMVIMIMMTSTRTTMMMMMLTMTLNWITRSIGLLVLWQVKFYSLIKDKDYY